MNISSLYDKNNISIRVKNVLATAAGPAFLNNLNTATYLGTTGTAPAVYGDIARTVSIASTSAVDNLSGTGAKTVLVFGINSAYEYISEVISLHATVGTTPVVGTVPFYRVFGAQILTTGTGLVNAGIIGIGTSSVATFTVGALTANHAWLSIPIGFNVGYSGIYTVPIGYNLRLNNIKYTLRTQPTDILLMSKHIPNGILDTVDFTYGGSNCGAVLPVGISYPEKTDVYLKSTGTAGGFVSAELSGRLFRV